MYFEGNQGEVDPLVGVEHEIPGADDGAQVVHLTQIQIAYDCKQRSKSGTDPPDADCCTTASNTHQVRCTS